MCPHSYYDMIRSDNHKQTLRSQMVHYAREHSVSAAARRFGTTRKTVRKWLGRHLQGQGLGDRSRRPQSCPGKTSMEIESTVVAERQRTGYGPHRLAGWLKRTRGLVLSAWTIRNILRRNGLQRRKRKRSSCYPAHWAWEEGEPFSLVQADVKDVHDKGTLGTERTTHLARLGLPRYQWTFLEAQSRLRFLAYSHRLTRDCAVAFLWLCLRWIRQANIATPVQIQTDWGEEFGGNNPQTVERLNRKYFAPLGGRLCRYPLGRKGYNGRIERLHRTDDEEFYIPTLLDIRTERDYLDRAFRWQAFYNLYRPHYGASMDGMSPIEKLRSLGINAHDSFALMPPVILDKVAPQIVAHTGYHVQAHYSSRFWAFYLWCLRKHQETPSHATPAKRKTTEVPLESTVAKRTGLLVA